MTIDDDATWYRGIMDKVKKIDKDSVTKTPGVIFMEIDGLAKNILLEAIELGDMPTLKRWIEEGSHELKGWELTYQAKLVPVKQEYYMGTTKIWWHLDGLKRITTIKSWFL